LGKGAEGGGSWYWPIVEGRKKIFYAKRKGEFKRGDKGSESVSASIIENIRRARY